MLPLHSIFSNEVISWFTSYTFDKIAYTDKIHIRWRNIITIGGKNMKMEHFIDFAKKALT